MRNFIIVLSALFLISCTKNTTLTDSVTSVTIEDVLNLPIGTELTKEQALTLFPEITEYPVQVYTEIPPGFEKKTSRSDLSSEGWRQMPQWTNSSYFRYNQSGNLVSMGSKSGRVHRFTLQNETWYHCIADGIPVQGWLAYDGTSYCEFRYFDGIKECHTTIVIAPHWWPGREWGWFPGGLTAACSTKRTKFECD